VKESHEFDVRRHRPHLRADLNNTVVLFAGGFECPAFVDIMVARLLHVNVFASLHCPKGGQSVPMVLCYRRDEIDCWVVKRSSHISDALRSDTPLCGGNFVHICIGHSCRVGIGIDDVEDDTSGVASIIIDVTLGLSACADNDDT
jgi:hypothetical protein